MSKSVNVTAKVTKIATPGNSAASLETIELPEYKAGPMSTNAVANVAMELLNGYKEMDGETFAKGVGALRNGTKFWDTMRGLRRLDVEQQRLQMRMNPKSTPRELEQGA